MQIQHRSLMCPLAIWTFQSRKCGFLITFQPNLLWHIVNENQAILVYRPGAVQREGGISAKFVLGSQKIILAMFGYAKCLFLVSFFKIEKLFSQLHSDQNRLNLKNRLRLSCHLIFWSEDFLRSKFSCVQIWKKRC